MIERLEVVAGPGTVIRYGGVVAWAAPSASPALISFLAQSARNLAGSGSGGRQMADHIAGVLLERDPEPNVAFAVVGPDAVGWASLLHGPVQAWDGQRWWAPTPAPGWLQAIITPQPSFIVSVVGSALPSVAPDSMWDLETGVVPGSGFVLFPTSAKRDEGLGAPLQGLESASAVQAEELVADSPPGGRFEDTEMFAADEFEKTSGFEVSAPTEVLDTVAEEPGPPYESQPVPPATPGPPGSIDLRGRVQGEGRRPLPVGVGRDRTIAGSPVVAGILCEREHLNRPATPECVRCGLPLRTDNQFTVSGNRPPLGCLVGDDRSIWRLDSGYVVGSNPHGDPTVRGGVARPLTLGGDGVSAAHAEVRLADWDVQVVDRSSEGGTFVFEPDGDSWLRLRPYEPRTLKPGTHVAFGRSVVTFLTPWISARTKTGNPNQT